MAKIQEIIGDDNSESNLTLLEDFTDTFDDLSSKANKGAGEWEEKYNDVNTKYTDLQKRYKERFFSGISNVKDNNTNYVPDPEPEEPDTAETITFNDLFTEKE